MPQYLFQGQRDSKGNVGPTLQGFCRVMHHDYGVSPVIQMEVEEVNL